MRRPHLGHVPLLLVLLLVARAAAAAPATVPTTAPAAVDLSSPLAAFLSAERAIVAGDEDAYRRCAAPGALDDPLDNEIIAGVFAAVRLHQAVERRLRPPARGGADEDLIVVDFREHARRMLRDAARWHVRIEGDLATLSPSPDDERGARLRRVGDRWLLDGGGNAEPRDPELRRTTAAIQRQKNRSFEAATRAVLEGRVTTVRAVNEMVRRGLPK